MTDDELSQIRNEKIGFIFQSYNLLPQLNVIENIEVPMFYRGVPERESRERAEELACTVGLQDRLNHRPYELSGGQQQRIAIARSLANKPRILLADEPTGNLDSVSGQDVLDLISSLHHQGMTIIMVTHDTAVASITQRTLKMSDGKIIEDHKNGAAT